MAEPITFATAAEQLRIGADTSEQSLIEGYIKAARGWVENYTGHVLVRRAITEQRDCFGSFIELHRRPIISVDEVGYTDSDGTAQTVDAFVAQLDRFPARIWPAVGESWPSIWSYGGISVTYTAGHEAGEEPQELLQAMLLLIGHWFSTRSAVNIGNIVNEVPLAVESLCDQFRGPGL